MVFPKTIKTRFLPGPGVRGKNERSCVRAQRAWEQGTDTVQGLTRVEARKVGLSLTGGRSATILPDLQYQNNLQLTRAIVQLNLSF